MLSAESVAPEGYELIKAEGDGNCFFHATAALINTHEDHLRLREEATAYAIEHVDDLAGFFGMERDEYIGRLATPGEWADHVAITVLASARRLDFRIHHADGHVTCVNPTAEDAVQVIDLAYNGSHYDALKCLPSPTAYPTWRLE